MAVDEGELYLMYYESLPDLDDDFREANQIEFVGVTRDEAQAKQFVAESPGYRGARYKVLDIDNVRFYYCVEIERQSGEVLSVDIDGSTCAGMHEEHVEMCGVGLVDSVYVFAKNEEEAGSRALELYKQEKEKIGKIATARAFAVVNGLARESLNIAKEIEERLAKGEKVDEQQN